MENPSRTSIWAAAARALGSRDPDLQVRNPDWLAERLLRPEELSLLGDHPLAGALSQPYESAAGDMEVLGAARTLIARTRFVDSRLEEAVKEGARQVVILGAGFDSRAYRFKELLSDVRLFEVDQPGTQRLKVRRIREAVGEPPDNLCYIEIDFRHDSLAEKLDKAGYQSNRKAFFIWEGVTMYLPEDVVRQTLQWVATNAAPGSSIVFDYSYATPVRMISSLDIDKLPEMARQAIVRFRRLTAGEPWIFGVPDGKEKEFLNEVGLELRRVMGMNSKEAVENYLTRADGTIFAGFPATEQQWYFILEAVVPV